MTYVFRRAVAVAGACATAAVVVDAARGDCDVARVARGGARAAYAAVTVARAVADYKTTSSEAMDAAHKRCAVRLHAMCTANGGLYVKAGQFISTAGGVPLAYVRELSKLQDEVAPADSRAVLAVVREEFGGVDARDLFETFDPEPMAAASLAQVHRAVLKGSGREVAVKIQRPGLEQTIESDISTMASLVFFTKLAFPSFDFGFMVDEFRSRLEKEIDFEAEGRNCERMKRAFADDERIDAPSVEWNVTRKRVLTMEFVHGTKVTDIASMHKLGLDPKQAALALSDAFARMLLVHSFVHGDPHPGNVLVREHPTRRGETQVVLLDHGLYSELDESARIAMSNLWVAIAVGDGDRAVAAAKRLRVPDEFTWLMPLALARKTTDGRDVDRKQLEQQWADNKSKGGVGRPGIGEASLIGNNMPKEMIIVLRANALVRNVIKALGNSHAGNISLLEAKRQWSNVRYAILGLCIPRGLGDSTIRTASLGCRVKWRLRTVVVGARATLSAFRRAFHRAKPIDIGSK